MADICLKRMHNHLFNVKSGLILRRRKKTITNDSVTMVAANRHTCDFATCSVKFGRLLITFANSLDPDQDRQNVGPDLDPNRLTR